MFQPLNRHILIEKIEEIENEPQESLILTPDDYKLKTSQFGLYQIVQTADDCEKITDYHINYNIVVEESMVQEITVNKQTYHIILENYVYGIYEQ